MSAAGAPLRDEDLARFRAARAEGAGEAAAFERMADGLDDERRARLARLMKASRASWSLLLAGEPGATLLVGDALSGAAIALALRARLLVLCDPRTARLELARAWLAAAAPETMVRAVAATAGRLPFADGAFDLVVHESAEAQPGVARELARVARGELALAGTLDGVEGFAEVREYALHPGREDPSQLEELGRAGPILYGGPSRRRAALLALARASGLLRRRLRARVVLARRVGARPALERALEALALRLDEAPQRAEHIVGSCGETCEVFTRGWRLHLALRPDHVPGLACNHAQLQRLRARRAELPIAEPLFAGELEGLWLTCERRLAGHAGDLVARELATADRVAEQAAAHLARLRSRAPAPLTMAEFEAELAPGFERALAITEQPAARRELEALREEARARLVGLGLPRAVLHGDLRAKHVQVLRGGDVTGYVHWGVATEEGLPFLDLVHLLVNARVQCAGASLADAWRALACGELRPAEARALAIHADELGVDVEAGRAMALAYPAFLATVAFSYAALAPPDWLARQLELG